MSSSSSHLPLLLFVIEQILKGIEKIEGIEGIVNTKQPDYGEWSNYNKCDMSLLALGEAYTDYILCKGIGEFNELKTCYNLMKNNLPIKQASH